MLSEFDDRPAIPLWLLAGAALAMVVHLYLVFMWVPTEATMGIVQRLFYFHVPAAVAQFTACFVGGIAAVLYLVKRDPKYDDLSLAANETVLVFGLVNVGLGMLWAKPIWGIWWTWDPRLTSSFVLLFLYGAYLVLRPAAPVESRGVVCAVVCILGMADVPLVYLSNRLFRTQHPAPVLGGGPDSGLAPPIKATLFFGMFTMMLLWVCVLLVRRRVARLERAAEDLTRRSHELEDVRSY
ncbi:MAG TPA: cytochrome c biogenesis protein CcsA [Bryobacteraceae bacterium]|nr:cytochrome c biogenesis protein CcsA [Bryobacteraceae bacterium]